MSILGAVVGGLFASSSANRAADAQEAAAQEQLKLQKKVYRDAAPYREAGTEALETYSGLVNTPFEENPAYQFRLKQGQDAIKAMQAANGEFFSGATGLALQEHGQQSASQEYDNYLRRLQGLANSGQQATMQSGQAYAAGAGQAYGNIGNAQSAGAIGAGNAITDGIQNVVGAWQYKQQQAQNDELINALRGI